LRIGGVNMARQPVRARRFFERTLPDEPATEHDRCDRQSRKRYFSGVHVLEPRIRLGYNGGGRVTEGRPVMTNEALADRIARLECHNRRLTGALVVVGIAAVVAGFLGAAPKAPRVVEADRFVLRDDDGRARALLTMDEKSPTLALFNEQGKARLTLRAAADGATLSIKDGSEAVAEVLVTEEGPGVKLLSGRSSVLVGIVRDGIGLGIVDRTGAPRERLVITPRGDSVFDLFDRNGRVLFRAP
jgi:hypothetical protein